MKAITYTPEVGALATCRVCDEPSRRNVVVETGAPWPGIVCEDCISHARLALRVGKTTTRHVSTNKRRPGGHLRRVK